MEQAGAASILAVTASAQSGAANHRTRPFHLRKECPPSTMQGQIGDYCTVTSSNFDLIPIGSAIVYTEAATADGVDSEALIGKVLEATPQKDLLHPE